MRVSSALLFDLGSGAGGAVGSFGIFGGSGAVFSEEVASLAFPLSSGFLGLIMTVSVVITGSGAKLFLNLKFLSSVMGGLSSVSIFLSILGFLCIDRNTLSDFLTNGSFFPVGDSKGVTGVAPSSLLTDERFFCDIKGFSNEFCNFFFL